MSTEPLILVVDDEQQIRRLLQMTLESNGYRVVLAETGKDGLTQASMQMPDLIILDLGLPDIEGCDVLKQLREWSTIPVVILSARNAEDGIIACIDAGADDYLVKPFRTGELLARLRMAMRHNQSPHVEPVYTFGDLHIDLSSRTVTLSGEPVKLTSTEYSILALFVQNAGRVLTHNFILQKIWGPAFDEERQYLRVYIAQLRKKIEADPALPRRIVTESRIGYRFASAS
ncbi:MAG TPA: response regulator [Bacteroidota bacterium]|nr:response regulator [Bacteroidota bacterium]